MVYRVGTGILFLIGTTGTGTDIGTLFPYKALFFCLLVEIRFAFLTVDSLILGVPIPVHSTIFSICYYLYI